MTNQRLPIYVREKDGTHMVSMRSLATQQREMPSRSEIEMTPGLTRNVGGIDSRITRKTYEHGVNFGRRKISHQLDLKTNQRSTLQTANAEERQRIKEHAHGQQTTLAKKVVSPSLLKTHRLKANSDISNLLSPVEMQQTMMHGSPQLDSLVSGVTNADLDSVQLVSQASQFPVTMAPKLQPLRMLTQ